MLILNLEDFSVDLSAIPAGMDDIRYAVLDNTDPTNVDYFFNPLLFLENFSCPAIVMRVGNSVMKVPIDWYLLIGEPDLGDLEALPLTSINERGFKAFQYNPRSGFKPTFLEIEIVDIYNDVNWFTPRLKSGQFLAVPLTAGDKPECIYFAKDVNRSTEIVDYSQVF
jgi:hypothetical protein